MEIAVINDLIGDAPTIGDNSGKAPLAELLAEETAELKKRSELLLKGARCAVVTNLDTAKEATVLVGQIRDHCREIETAREARKRPYLDGCRTVDSHFGALRFDLIGPDPNRLGGEAARVKRLIDDFHAELERQAELERRRQQEEARRKAEEAAAADCEREEAERQAQAAMLAGDVQGAVAAAVQRTDAEARRQQLQEEARVLAGRAADTRGQVIDTGLGVKAHRQTRWRPEITDLAKALRHALKINPAVIRAAVQAIYDRQVSAGIRELPGANVVPVRDTVIRRA